MRALHEMGIVETADAVARGESSAEAFAHAALARMKRLGPGLNAVARLDEAGALEAARAVDLARLRGARLGPLAGVPLAHKDLVYRAGRISAGGSLVRRHYVPAITATVLTRLDAAGALDLGALHMSEFALSPSGLNVHYGHGRNPWNMDYCPGGSSSGCGAAVAARLVAGSLGSDTGGSIRHPAAMCGITGLKPTHGLVSQYGTMPLSPTLDCLGPMARSARDVARLLAIIAGPDPQDGATAHGAAADYERALTGDIRGLRIAVPDPYYRDETEPEVLGLLDQSLAIFKSCGARVIRTSAPDMGVINACMQLVMGAEAATLHLRSLREHAQDYGAQVRSRILPGLAYSATRYIEALMMRADLARQWLATAMKDADLVHLPTLPIAVPSIADTTQGDPDRQAAVLGRITHCTRGINYLGLPALAIPCGFSGSGLPVSFQLVGRPFDEATLLRAGDAYQRQTDFHTRMPPNC